MCGIFAVVNDQNNQAGKTVLEGLKMLEYRGYDSWGIAIKEQRVKSKNKGLKIKNKRLFVEKHIGKISQADVIFPSGKIAIGHTRWATHGGVTDKNSHPHLDCSGRIAVVHNGIIENYQVLRGQLKAKGHKFISETDTEVMAHLIEEELKTKDIIQAVFIAFSQAVGSNAIVVLDSQSESVISCRYGSPIIVGLGKKEYFLASDATPFLGKTKRAIFINDGEGVVLSKEGVGIYNLKTGRKKRKKIKIIDWQIEKAQKNNYTHFLLKEIMEQRETIANTVASNKREIKYLSSKIKKAGKVIMFGCGSAWHCTLAAKYFFAKAEIEAESYSADEFSPFAKFCFPDRVAIAVSQSGETADTLIAAKKIKEKKTYLAAIINAPGSTLERLTDSVLKVKAGPEMAVVSTKAFTSQLITLYLLSQAAANKYDQGIKKIRKLRQALKRWLNQGLEKRVMALAKTLMNCADIYIIGKYLNYPAALEFALKIKETSYIHAEAFSSGELKHGVISLVDKGTPAIVLASNNKFKKEVLSSAAEIKARGGEIIGVAPFAAQEFDQVIKTPDLGELTIFANIIVGQLLGYYLGIGRGVDPDRPRNLAKSVTVK